MRPFAPAFLAIALAIVAPAGFPSGAASADPPIRIGLTDSPGQRIVARVTGEALRAAEYSVDYVEIEAEQQFVLLAAGKIHFQPEVWSETLSPDYRAALDKGGVVELGSLGIDPASVVKLAWKNAARKWPGAVKMLRTLSLPAEHRDAMLAEVEAKGRAPEAVVSDWMVANEPLWRRWLTSKGNWMKAN